jgi:hypothetical protein
MTTDTENQKKEDIELFHLRRHIINSIRDFNVRLKQLEDARGKYVRYTKVTGLMLQEIELEKVL